MKRIRIGMSVACASLVAACAFAGTAAPASVSTYVFYGCVGPSGTPTTFTAVKTALPQNSPYSVSAAAAFRLTDGSAVFVVLSFGEGNFSPPGIGVSGNATVTCTVSTSSGIFAYSGLLAPRH